jgi:hypothetical protein
MAHIQRDIEERLARLQAQQSDIISRTQQHIEAVSLSILRTLQHDEGRIQEAAEAAASAPLAAATTSAGIIVGIDSSMDSSSAAEGEPIDTENDRIHRRRRSRQAQEMGGESTAELSAAERRERRERRRARRAQRNAEQHGTTSISEEVAGLHLDPNGDELGSSSSAGEMDDVQPMTILEGLTASIFTQPSDNGGNVPAQSTYTVASHNESNDTNNSRNGGADDLEPLTNHNETTYDYGGDPLYYLENARERGLSISIRDLYASSDEESFPEEGTVGTVAFHGTWIPPP